MIDEKKARRVIDFIHCLKHTKGEFHGKPFRLLPWQEKIIRDVFGTVREDDPTMRQYTTAYIEIPKKQGKALALSTLLPTPQGWKQMGDIRVGDQVFDEAGRPCNVVALSEVFDDETCYRLTFRDGSSIEAGERHLWRVEVTNNGKREKLLTSGEIYRRMVEYRKRHPGDAGRRSVIRIPVARALQLPERELPIDPYLMGYWLGNGKSTDYEITVRDSDVEAIRAQIPYEIKSEVVQPGSHRLRIPALKAILVDSFRDKAIPSEYLRASEGQRWSLLQGLMDSDGCITGWLNELAFVPVDANPSAMVDEWSGDYGCGVKYFSQDGVIKLAPRAGIELTGASPAEKLKEVQALMAADDARAKAVYESIGVYLGHTLGLYAMFYDIRHVQMMGRVMSGKGGDIIMETASRVMDEEYPDVAFRPEAPDEKTRRVGQSAAAASLPELK